MDVAGSEDPNLSYDWEESGGELPLVEWSVEDVCSWLEELGLTQYCETFRYNRVHGKKLMQVHCSDLPKMNITQFEHILQISRAIDDLSGRPQEKCEPTMSTVHLPVKSAAVLSKSFGRY